MRMCAFQKWEQQCVQHGIGRPGGLSRLLHLQHPSQVSNSNPLSERLMASKRSSITLRDFQKPLQAEDRNFRLNQITSHFSHRFHMQIHAHHLQCMLTKQDSRGCLLCLLISIWEPSEAPAVLMGPVAKTCSHVLF